MKSYVEDGHDIDLEEDIVNAISHRQGIAGTTAVLVDATNLHGTALEKPFKSRNIGSRETHKVIWHENKVDIIKSSGISEPVTVQHTKLMQHSKCNLNVEIAMYIASNKPSLFVPSEKQVQRTTSVSTSKSDAYVEGLNQAGMLDNIGRQNDSYRESSITPVQCYHGWATYPRITGEKFSYEVVQKLQQLYVLGKQHKKRKVSAECAY